MATYGKSDPEKRGFFGRLLGGKQEHGGCCGPAIVADDESVSAKAEETGCCSVQIVAEEDEPVAAEPARAVGPA